MDQMLFSGRISGEGRGGNTLSSGERFKFRFQKETHFQWKNGHVTGVERAKGKTKGWGHRDVVTGQVGSPSLSGGLDFILSVLRELTEVACHKEWHGVCGIESDRSQGRWASAWRSGCQDELDEACEGQRCVADSGSILNTLVNSNGKTGAGAGLWGEWVAGQDQKSWTCLWRAAY